MSSMAVNQSVHDQRGPLCVKGTPPEELEARRSALSKKSSSSYLNSIGQHLTAELARKSTMASMTQ
jgi:hypothetical protein